MAGNHHTIRSTHTARLIHERANAIAVHRATHCTTPLHLPPSPKRPELDRPATNFLARCMGTFGGEVDEGVATARARIKIQ
ncbi:hypothetical protein E2562_016994 [Oryza meyeriana var. granulata]|uniref:Uncharacterized protein n=1 Tax=Oryza meyeriana var. granulata TaxID=110450 RepID=A0A6G1EAM7_9ORYZ|nr:hypothetical protein E2562_016994 [Oryza meyeriana var. granulata]